MKFLKNKEISQDPCGQINIRKFWTFKPISLYILCPIKTSPSPCHLGFTTPLTSYYCHNDNFSPFFSVIEIAASACLEDTFYGTGLTVWGDNDPLSYNSAPVDNTPLQKRSFSSTAKNSLDAIPKKGEVSVALSHNHDGSQ